MSTNSFHWWLYASTGFRVFWLDLCWKLHVGVAVSSKAPILMTSSCLHACVELLQPERFGSAAYIHPCFVWRL